MEKEEKQRVFLLFLLCIPLFIAIGYFANKTYDARGYDFAAYWQAAHMVSQGGNVYDTSEWLSVREKEQTALHSEITFQYPLPLAVLMAPLGLLPVGQAYVLWLLLGQIAILVSILLLFRLQEARLPFLEIAMIAVLFLFRPMYTVILSGQILAVLLFFTTTALFTFSRRRWFAGGLLISALGLKPSIGLPILAILGLWLLAKRSGRGILGLFSGAIILFSIGVLYEPAWVVNYLTAGQHLLTRYMGMHSTLWGMATLLFKDHWFSLVLAGIGIGAVLLTLTWLFFFKKIQNPFAAMAVILASGLLIAPYSWSYDQILLLVTMFFIMNEIGRRKGFWVGFLFLPVMIVIAALLALLAYQLNHDVWSILVTLLTWGFAVYFASQEKPRELHKSV